MASVRAEAASGILSSEFKAGHVELYNAAYDAWEELVALARRRDEERRYPPVDEPRSYARCYVREIRPDAIVVVCPYREFQALLCARGARRVVDASSTSTFVLRLASDGELAPALAGLIDLGFSFLRDARGAASPAGIVEGLWAKGFTAAFMELVRHADGTSRASHCVPDVPPGPGGDTN